MQVQTKVHYVSELNNDIMAISIFSMSLADILDVHTSYAIVTFYLGD